MRKSLCLLGALVCFGWAGPAEAYQFVAVESGGVILVTAEDGRELRLELAGVWVPTPPGGEADAEYRGAEALSFVRTALGSLPARVRELEPPDPETGTVPVQIRLGEEGQYDLAILLADAGLALMERGSSAEAEHLKAIRKAERNARVEQRGMHDGGLRNFQSDRAERTVDLGTDVIAPPERSQWGAFEAYVSSRASAGHVGRYDIHGHPVSGNTWSLLDPLP